MAANDINDIVERLRTLGVFPDSVQKSAEIFAQCPNLDDIAQQLEEDHSSCGEDQFVYFHLQALFKYDPEYKSRFLEKAV